jgi:hypothetical protein
MAEETELTPAAPVVAKPEGVIKSSEKTVATAVKDGEARAAALEKAVQDWVSKEMKNSPLSRSTVAWNHFQAKIPALIEAIKKEL